VLQIVTKMYFREGVPLHSTVHREVLYTNCSFLPFGVVVDLPVGELAPSTGMMPVSTVTLSVTEHLEAEDPDGEPSMRVATGGTELVDALADVLSFGLNAVFSRDRDLVKRLVPDSLDDSRRSSASRLFRRTFDAHRYVPEEELEELRRFMTQLLGLKRSHFEAATRAIRRIVRATQRSVDDPTIGYVDLVAALESLSDGTSAPGPTWDQMPGRKQRLIDDALEGVDADLASRVRDAVMEAERLGTGSKFVAFVMENISPDYFRTEAIDALRPFRGADLERALKLAYRVRSRNVHTLADLPQEAWVLGDRADTVSPPGMGIMLSHEGLARLARHVVRSYVDRAPVEVEPEFDWRASLPGVIQMRVAPQYWVWQAAGFDHKSVSKYFSGFVSHLIETLAERNDGVVDIRPVLERIEQFLPGTANGPAKSLMVAIYALWHSVVAQSDRRADATGVLAQHEHLLQKVEVSSFVVGLLSEQMPQWTDDEWHRLATGRRAERLRPTHVELPASVDAALQVMTAERLMAAGRTDEARSLAGFALEELPGNEPLRAWEAGLATGEPHELDLRALVLQLEPSAEPQEEPSDGALELVAPPEPDALVTNEEDKANDIDVTDDEADG
jgi:hypothetical protein